MITTHTAPEGSLPPGRGRKADARAKGRQPLKGQTGFAMTAYRTVERCDPMTGRKRTYQSPYRAELYHESQTEPLPIPLAQDD